MAMRRKSKQKEAILRILRGTHSHPTAEWLYEEVRREIPRISLGTVYRNLRLLRQDGEISELDFAGAQSRFDGNTQNHDHFVCEQCGRMFDVEGPDDKAMDDGVVQKTGFKVTHHRLEFRGLCEDCQR